MKKKFIYILISVLSCFIVTSCNDSMEQDIVKEYTIVEIDSCEYIMYSKYIGRTGYGYMAHKGNCKFCEKRYSLKLRQIIREELQLVEDAQPNK